MKKKHEILSAMFAMNAVALGKVTTAENEDGTIPIKGYACHFGVANLNHEIVTKDSFDKGFEVMKRAGIMPTLNYMHTGEIIGVTDLLKPDDKGLWLEGRIVKTAFVRDTLIPLMDAGTMNCLSTEGFVTRWTTQEDSDNYIADEFTLLRVSVVDIPADMSAIFSRNAITLERAKEDIDRAARTIDLLRAGVVI